MHFVPAFLSCQKVYDTQVIWQVRRKIAENFDACASDAKLTGEKIER